MTIDNAKKIDLKISNILDMLNCPDAEPSNEILAVVWHFFLNNRRHSYHEITKYIIKINNEQGIDAAVYVAENISLLMEFIQAKIECNEAAVLYHCKRLDPIENIQCEETLIDGYYCYQYKLLYRFVQKIYDHLRLEITRIQDLPQFENKEYQKTIESLRKDYNFIQQKVNTLDVSTDDLKNGSEKLEQAADELKKETKNIYIQIVSILGIFSAIIVAVFGGVNVLGTTISDIDNLYKSLFIFSTGFLLIFDLVFVLLTFIARLYLRDRLSLFLKCVFAGVNILCVVGVIVSIALCLSGFPEPEVIADGVAIINSLKK